MQHATAIRKSCTSLTSHQDTAQRVHNPSGYYTAWCAPALEKKGLISTDGHPRKIYHLTADGRHLASELYQEAVDDGSLPREFLSRAEDLGTETVTKIAVPIKELAAIPIMPMTPLPTTAVVPTNTVGFAPHIITILTPNPKFMNSPCSYEVELIVDSRETNNKRKTGILHAIESSHISYTVETLPVGDYAWKARGQACEYLVDVVVERKSLDDLAQSIQHGRYVDQKYRLQFASHLTRVIYLVEGSAYSNRAGLPSMALLTACMETQVCDIC